MRRGSRSGSTCIKSSGSAIRSSSVSSTSARARPRQPARGKAAGLGGGHSSRVKGSQGQGNHWSVCLPVHQSVSLPVNLPAHEHLQNLHLASKAISKAHLAIHLKRQMYKWG